MIQTPHVRDSLTLRTELRDAALLRATAIVANDERRAEAMWEEANRHLANLMQRRRLRDRNVARRVG